MHLDLRRYLDEVAQTHAADPLGYLWEFGPVHAWWHRERRSELQPIGFLTFHRLLIRSFRRTFPGGWIPVQPASLLPFPSVLADRAAATHDLAALQAYSAALEGWHDGVHGTIGGGFGDPQHDVLLRWFWEFHLFLDLQFSRALESWGVPWTTYVATVPEADQRLI